MTQAKQEDEGKVRVFCRFRPMNLKEKKLGGGEVQFRVEDGDKIVLTKVEMSSKDQKRGGGRSSVCV